MSEHGHCPHCGVDLDGGSIYEHFLKEYNGDEERALHTAEMYGATKTTGQWGRQLAIYDRDKDRTVAYECPDCKQRWDR